MALNEGKQRTSEPAPMPEFKYALWTRRFRNRIENGDLPAGSRLPSYRDLRERHGLSRATVDRIYDDLESLGLVAREARRGMFVAERPSDRRAVDTVCVVCRGFGQFEEHPYYARMIGAAHRVASGDGMHILLSDGENLPDMAHIGGVLQITPFLSLIRDCAGRLVAEVPLVSVLGALPGVPAVVADEPGGVRAAIDHLTALGHRRIAMLAHNVHAPVSRIEAYRQAMAAAGIAADSDWLRVMPDQNPSIPYLELGHREMAAWLRRGFGALGCTALFCQNDDAATGAILAAEEAGLDVPRDLSVVGFDGTNSPNYLTPRLTTVEMPLEGLIERAWQLLGERQHPLPAERPAAEVITLSTRLRLGQSTAPVAGADSSFI